jgi:hypothetical protein
MSTDKYDPSAEWCRRNHWLLVGIVIACIVVPPLIAWLTM